MDIVEINIDKEQITKSLNEYPEVYYSTKNKLRLTINQRLKPKVDERDLIYQLLSIHGISWEDMD